MTRKEHATTSGDRQRPLGLYKRGGESLAGDMCRIACIHSVWENCRVMESRAADILLSRRWATPPAGRTAADLPGICWHAGEGSRSLLVGKRTQRSPWRQVAGSRLSGRMRDLTMIRHLALVEHLVDLLRERVGAPLSINNLRETCRSNIGASATWMRPSSVCMWSSGCSVSGGLARTTPQGGQGFFWDGRGRALRSARLRTLSPAIS